MDEAPSIRFAELVLDIARATRFFSRRMDLRSKGLSISDEHMGVLVIEPRLLRRVIKRHRALSGIGLQVPHAGCYALSRGALVAVIEPRESADFPKQLAADLILVPEPRAEELIGTSDADQLVYLWRSAFHGAVHLAMQKLIAEGKLDDTELRRRIDHIGQIEFDEVRSVVRQDDLLLPPHDDRETYVELAALLLELHYFEPARVDQIFPSIGKNDRALSIIKRDLPDGRELVLRLRPEGAPPLDAFAAAERKRDAATSSFSAPPTLSGVAAFFSKQGRARDPARVRAAADKQRRRGNLVGAALLIASLFASAAPHDEARLRAELRSDLDKLGARLREALKPLSGEPDPEARAEWTSLLVILAEEVGNRRALRYPPEARLLYDLQAACAAHERTSAAIDVITWVLSRFRRPLIRKLPMTQPVRVLRHLRSASSRLRHVRLDKADRRLLGRILRWACERAEANLREHIEPHLSRTLTAVGLGPSNIPERIAHDKVVQELLDHAAARGFFNLGHVRDALSKSQLKLGDLSGTHEFLLGDSLLQLDKELAVRLDGVYRPGEAYLRLLQKLSSLFFGTRKGRVLSLYVVLPLLSAFVVLEGIAHMINPILASAGVAKVDLMRTPIWLSLSALLFALLHSKACRDAALFLSRRAGWVLHFIFIQMPARLWRLPQIRKLLQNKVFRAAIRFALLPAGITWALYFLTPIHAWPTLPSLISILLIFIATNLAINSTISIILEEVLLERIFQTWRLFHRRLLPGLFKFIIDIFKTLIELFERAVYKVDEWLRLREDQHSVILWTKGAGGLFWFFIAYVIRLYVVLLIEPEVNPIKHFPVVTVAHKILLPLTPPILGALQTALSPLGSVISNTIAGPTVFLLPSFFGFLAWELKENYRLYRENRPRMLGPIPIGIHGETMGAFLKPGFHSGTLPKQYRKIRGALRKNAVRPISAILKHTAPNSINPNEERLAAAQTDALRHIEQAVCQFFEREFIALLTACPRFAFSPLELGRIELSSNRIRIQIHCSAIHSEPMELAFEEQSGFLVAGISKRGFLKILTRTSSKSPPPDPKTEADYDEALLLLENALAGLYKLAGIDLVRERIEAALGGKPPYDIADEGILVWPDGAYRTQLVYELNPHAQSPLRARVEGEPPRKTPPALPPQLIFFQRVPISWRSWLIAWMSGSPIRAQIPRLLEGPSILPGFDTHLIKLKA